MNYFFNFKLFQANYVEKSNQNNSRYLILLFIYIFFLAAGAAVFQYLEEANEVHLLYESYLHTTGLTR